MKKHYLIAALAGAAIGFYLASAPTGTGIYASFVGQTAANLWTSGYSTATGTTATS